MKGLLQIGVLLTSSTAAFGQGTVLFANRIPEAGLDSPVFIIGTQQGPGPGYTAQLFLVGLGGSLTPLMPTTTFQAAGSGSNAILDRYLSAQSVVVPTVMPGNQATLVVRSWITSLGSFQQDINGRGESAPFTVTLGNAQNPSALLGLQSFQVGTWPEPSTYVLAFAGGAILLVWRRRA